MKDLTRRTTAVFSRPFSVPGFDETLPAGKYDIETELCSPPDNRQPDVWKASVVIKLQPGASLRGLATTLTVLTVSLADLDKARAKDKLSGSEPSDSFLEEMLADPMIRLVMAADSVSETQLRNLYSASRRSQAD